MTAKAFRNLFQAAVKGWFKTCFGVGTTAETLACLIRYS